MVNIRMLQGKVKKEAAAEAAGEIKWLYTIKKLYK
jgi:hypothetical protein